MGKGDETRSKWLSTTQAAAELGLTLRTVYRLLDEGGLAAYKFGRVMRTKTVDVETFIDASRVEPGTLGHLYPPPVARQEVRAEEAPPRRKEARRRPRDPVRPRP